MDESFFASKVKASRVDAISYSSAPVSEGGAFHFTSNKSDALIFVLKLINSSQCRCPFFSTLDSLAKEIETNKNSLKLPSLL